jgi:hypothetical protein
VEFLSTLIQVSHKLHGILRLSLVLLLLLSSVSEFSKAGGAVASALTFNALVMVGVAAHEVNGGEREGVLARVAVFGVEVLGFGFQVSDLLLHLVNALDVFFDLLIGLANHSVLHFQATQQIFLYNSEFKIGLALEDFEHQ